MIPQALQDYAILYAEDNLATQASTTEYLNRYFKKVYVANDGKEALALYHSKSIDVLLLDIDMPYLDGICVAREIRKENEVIPILILTAFTDQQMLLDAIELNLCKYLVKPIEPKVFKEALQLLSERLEKQNHNCIVLGEGYRWQKDTQRLYKAYRLVNLSQKEQILLSLLMKHYKQCVTFEEIMATVWADDFDAEISLESVKQQVARLRKNLPKGSIQNVYAKGYILR